MAILGDVLARREVAGMRRDFRFPISDFRFFLVAIFIAIACQQQPTEAPIVDATPPDQTPAGPSEDTMAPPVSTPQAPATTPDTAGVRRITLADATAALNSGEAVLVDVRGETQYSAEHARGAIHIPEDQIINRLADIPMGKMIITYCT